MLDHNENAVPAAPAALALALAGGGGAVAAVRRDDVRRRLRGPGIARAGANGDRPSPAGANPGAHAVAIPHSPSDGNRNAAAYPNTYANAGAHAHAAPNADFRARADADRYASAVRPPGAYWRCRLCR